MGRRAEGWKLCLDRRSGVYGVRWTRDGVRRYVSTGARDPEEAARAAASIYAASVSGRLRRRQGHVGRHELDALGSRWIAEAEHALDSETSRTYQQYVAAWSDFFHTLDRLTGPAIEDFWRSRLRRVKRRTVIKQLYALNGFLRWCRSRRLLDAIPAYDMPPKSATGTPAKGRSTIETVALSAAEVDALLGKLPEWSERAHKAGKRWRVRDRFAVAWETALRPATLNGLRAPDDYQHGDATLRIRDEIDKARFGREVPLSVRAREALDRCAPKLGAVLGAVDSHTAARYLRMAAEAAGLPADKAAKVKPYDLRHARLTLLAESGNLVGVAYLAGHKAITTTNRYVHAHARAATEVLNHAAKGMGFGMGEQPARGRKQAKKKAAHRR